VRARMGVTGEKYTEARRSVLAMRENAPAGLRRVERITVHMTNNGLDLADQDCEAMTKKGRQCRNPFIYGQFWPGGHPEVVLHDGADTRMLAQRRCAVHVDHTRRVEVTLVMDDVVPSRFLGPYPKPVWQDPRSLQMIRQATEGRQRTDVLALYLALTEHQDDASLAAVAERAGLSEAQAVGAVRVIEQLGFFRDGTLIG
jgi:hypothetical protein